MTTTSNPILAMLKVTTESESPLHRVPSERRRGTKRILAQTTFEELEIHGLKEEFFYPAIRKGTKDDKLDEFRQ